MARPKPKNMNSELKIVLSEMTVEKGGRQFYLESVVDFEEISKVNFDLGKVLIQKIRYIINFIIG